jgi:hypothetical protein
MVSRLPLRRLAFDELASPPADDVPVVTQTFASVDNTDLIDLNDAAQLDAHTAALEAQLISQENDATTAVDEHNGTTNIRKKKKKTSKVAAFKLTAISVHNLLRDTVLEKLKRDIENGVTKKGNPFSSLKKSLGFFQTQTYNTHVTVASGQSRRIATQKAQSSVTEVPDVIYEANLPTFDLKKATKAAPDIPWKDIVPTFTLDSRRLRRYIVEDVMYSNPATRERLLLLVCVDSPDFTSKFLRIYNNQRPLRPAIQFERLLYIQIEAEVIKNFYRDSFVRGLNDVDTVKYLLTRVGGGGIGVHFCDCPN